jgi:hypothetical protein
MPDLAREQEHRDEAERLAALPPEEQMRIIAMHRADAANPKVPKRDRAFAAERADALERHLRRLRKKRKS